MYESTNLNNGRVLFVGNDNCIVYQDGNVVHRTRRVSSPRLPSLLIVHAAGGSAKYSSRGLLPSDHEVEQWAGTFDWVVVMHHNLYDDHPSSAKPNSAPPYTPIFPDELRRFNAACLRNDIVSLAYVSPFDYARDAGRDTNWDWFQRHVDSLLMEYGYRGLYVDGLLFDYGQYKLDDWRMSLEVAAMLRLVTGPRGIMVGHLSHGNHPAAFLPDVEEVFDAVLKGEGAQISSLDDSYLNNEIATTKWTRIPVGWLYHRYWDRLSKNVTLDELMYWQVEHGMMGLSYAQMKDVGGRTTWSDGRTSYYTAWLNALNEAGSTE